MEEKVKPNALIGKLESHLSPYIAKKLANSIKRQSFTRIVNLIILQAILL